MRPPLSSLSDSTAGRTTKLMSAWMTGAAEHRDPRASRGLREKELVVLNQDVCGAVEQRRLVLRFVLDVDDVDVDAVVAPGHLFDTEDHRGPVVVAIGELDHLLRVPVAPMKSTAQGAIRFAIAVCRGSEGVTNRAHCPVAA
jgi:hypothetical protein